MRLYIQTLIIRQNTCFLLLVTVPTFINSSQYSTEHNCYWYSLPTISYGDRVTMRVDVLDDNLTLIWTVTINGHTEVIDKYNGQYIREDHNKVR